MFHMNTCGPSSAPISLNLSGARWAFSSAARCARDAEWRRPWRPSRGWPQFRRRKLPNWRRAENIGPGAMEMPDSKRKAMNFLSESTVGRAFDPQEVSSGRRRDPIAGGEVTSYRIERSGLLQLANALRRRTRCASLSLHAGAFARSPVESAGSWLERTRFSASLLLWQTGPRQASRDGIRARGTC